jgi:bile-acid 7alpha-dehydratase
MAGIADLEARIKLLEGECRELRDIESIRRLKAKYFRSMDKKLWEEFANCWAEDAVADWGPEMKFQGKDAIVSFFKQTLKDSVVGVHQGHNAEINITSSTTANAVWELWDQTVDIHIKRGVRLLAFYEDEYVKEKGKWKIRASKTVPLYQERTKEVDGEWKTKA